MAQFFLTTTWLVEAPLEKVWEAIYQSERWPSWWRYVVRVQESVRGENGGLGNWLDGFWG